MIKQNRQRQDPGLKTWEVWGSTHMAGLVTGRTRDDAERKAREKFSKLKKFRVHRRVAND